MPSYYEEMIPAKALPGVRQGNDGVIIDTNNEGREEIICFTQCGHDCTSVDLLDLIEYLKKHRPELLTSAGVPLTQVDRLVPYIAAREDLLREVLAPSDIACSGEALEALRSKITALGITKAKS